MYGEYGNGTVGNADATVNSIVTYNSWQHLSYIIDITNKVIMYLKNGVPVKTSSISDNIIPANVGTNNANFNIGAFIGGTYNMLAYMKYIKVYNIASSVSEIKADYDASKSIFGL